ncbi:Protein CBFA2T3 [Lachnellula suecica]|uniref:Protein CBFA2T3 n=1 Tax=Lachnellula suecica TaxID=602035 RepID=A0A8T9BY14_9HELO|nr:Protein CBFA2T3 [Lachnellula suecica]
MAPPRFPNGMSLYTIGFAALRYPALPPPPVDVPLTNQMQEPEEQNHMIAQIASQYLESLLSYQTSNEPTLHDPSLPQYYFSTAICLLNLLNTNPDVCKRIAAHPALVNNVIEKLLAPDFVDKMKGAPRPGGAHFPAATFEEDFGSVLQFLSTMLLYKDQIPLPHPRIQELIPKLRTWKQTYRSSSVKTISNASERLIQQIDGSMSPTMVAMMRSMQDESLVCGVASCGVQGRTDLTPCGGCKIQRYCGSEHQRADWKYHKHICNKGLQGPAENSPVAPEETS